LSTGCAVAVSSRGVLVRVHNTENRMILFTLISFF
jgi:hypothetical protein